MMTGYDSKTAVTFLLIGLGAGVLLSVVLAPRYSKQATQLPRKDMPKMRARA